VARRIAILLNPPRGDGPKAAPSNVGDACVEVVLDMAVLQVRTTHTPPLTLVVAAARVALVASPALAC
jgi:hypothetical protein